MICLQSNQYPEAAQASMGRREMAYKGTAGLVFDFSPAGGLKSVLSSFSKTVFSEDTIRRVAMILL